MAFYLITCILILSSVWRVHSKIYERCELARELRDVHEIPEHQLATWLCITKHESQYDTSAHNTGSGDHGLFQISQLYWCSPPGNGLACGISCADLKNDDIEDDVICAKRIYRQHQRISGDGFTAWVVYNLHCKDSNYVNSFLDGCFDTSLKYLSKTEAPINVSTPKISEAINPNLIPTAKISVYKSTLNLIPSELIVNERATSRIPTSLHTSLPLHTTKLITSPRFSTVRHSPKQKVATQSPFKSSIYQKSVTIPIKASTKENGYIRSMGYKFSLGPAGFKLYWDGE